MHKFRRARLTVSLASIVWMTAPGMVSSAAQQGDTFSRLVEKAKKANEENRLDEAAGLYGKALTLRPRWVEGWWLLGTIEYDQDHYAQAAQAFERLIVLDSRNGTAYAMLGLCQFELGKDEPALRNLMAAESLGIVKDEQLREVAVYHLGLLQLRARKFSSAEETLKQLAKDGARTKELTVALGQAALLVRPQDTPPDGTPGASVVERAGEAETLLAAKEFERARQIYGGLANEYPDYPNLHAAFGRFLLEMHETDEAVEEFQRELKHDPKNVNSLLEIAAVRYQMDSQDGLKYAEHAVNLAPQLPFAHYLLGLLRLDTDDAAGAIPELEIARKGFPNEPKVYFALGNAYARVGRKMEAAKARAEFTRLNALTANRIGTSVYGEQPARISERQLQTADKEKPRP